jgi:hypothetical protein
MTAVQDMCRVQRITKAILIFLRGEANQKVFSQALGLICMSVPATNLIFLSSIACISLGSGYFCASALLCFFFRASFCISFSQHRFHALIGHEASRLGRKQTRQVPNAAFSMLDARYSILFTGVKKVSSLLH